MAADRAHIAIVRPRVTTLADLIEEAERAGYSPEAVVIELPTGKRGAFVPVMSDEWGIQRDHWVPGQATIQLGFEATQ